MTVQAIAIRMGPGSRPQHITRFKLVDRVNASVFDWSVSQLVGFLEPPSPGRGDCLSNSGVRTELEVMHSNPPYVRSKADGTTTDNLLSLPRF